MAADADAVDVRSHAASDIDVERYLARIGWTGPRPAPGADALAALQLAHMTAVPFENLDVVAGRRPRTTLDWSGPKIVADRRGGWCFELNGVFAALLAGLGYAVTLHSAQVWDPAAERFGPELDHLCLVVTVDGSRWLVDAGFGDSSLAPVLLDTAEAQPRAPRPARVDVDGGGRIVYSEWIGSERWQVQYAVDPTPRGLTEFQPRSDELATGAGGGHFTEKPFATRALDGTGARVWLLRDRLKLRRNGDESPTEHHVPADEWPATLREWFGMDPVSR